MTFSEIKLQRAYGGCLGVRSRRRTQQAAKRHGKEQASNEPCISDWGNPPAMVPEREADPVN